MYAASDLYLCNIEHCEIGSIYIQVDTSMYYLCAILDGENFANKQSFAKFFHHQSFPLYGIPKSLYHIDVRILITCLLEFASSNSMGDSVLFFNMHHFI